MCFLPSQFMGRWFEIAKLPAQFEKGRCIETNFTMRTDNSIRVVSSEILWVLSASSLCKWGVRRSFLYMCLFSFNLTWNLNLKKKNRKGELKKIEGTGVIEDMKNPAKLGISYSYGEFSYIVYSPENKCLKFSELVGDFLKETLLIWSLQPHTFTLVLPYSPYWILSTDYVNTALVYSCTDILRLFHVDFAWILGRTRTLPASTIEKAKETFANNNIDVTRMIASRQQGCDKTLWAALEMQHKMALLVMRRERESLSLTNMLWCLLPGRSTQLCRSVCLCRRDFSPFFKTV